jgi:hypothetical protein
MHFCNLLIVASTTALAVAAPSVGNKKRAKKFHWFGVNESGAELGNTALPGQLNKDYVWPPTYVIPMSRYLSYGLSLCSSTIDTLVGEGMNIFRKSFTLHDVSTFLMKPLVVPTMMERLIPVSMTGSVNATYRDPMVQYLNYITSKGAYAIILTTSVATITTPSSPTTPVSKHGGKPSLLYFEPMIKSSSIATMNHMTWVPRASINSCKLVSMVSEAQMQLNNIFSSRAHLILELGFGICPSPIPRR